MEVPALRTSTELSLIETGLFPEDTIAVRLASITTKNNIEAMIIPVIVASVYLRKLFILRILILSEML
jgi:hypothetical protein